MLLALLATPAPGQDQRTVAQDRLQAVQQEITRLQRELEADRDRQSQEQAQLKALDLELQELALEARELQARIAARQTGIDTLLDQQTAQLEQLTQGEQLLGEQLVGAWRLGRQSRLRLILNQDEPAPVSRLLAYYEHFTSAQSDRLANLRDSLLELDRLGTQLQHELSQLAVVETRQQAQQEALQQRRGQQQALLAALAADLASTQTQLDELTRNREDLEKLLRRLDDALADIPADIGGRIHPRALKGQLPMPVTGPVARAFGQARAAGLRWQGWLIGADAGQEIRAVAYGRVAYADWLRGYGLLLIIDHGDGFMSLYGHNESLLSDVGDWVQSGQVVATVGRQGDQPEGLYFELRSGGSAVDPAAWIKRR